MDFTECYSDTVSSLAAVAKAGSRRKVRELIDRGCSIDSKDNRGWTPLHHAAAAGSKACVRELLSAAGSSQQRRDYVCSRTHEGESALYLAAQRGHLAVVRLLLGARADINQSTNDGSCPLYTAVDGRNEDIVKLFIRKGAEINGTHTESCWSCLHQAAYKGCDGIVRLLVAVPGCQLEARDDHNITPLFVAAQYGHQLCLESLVNAGADVNTQAVDLATPLMIASQEGHEGCVEVLLAHGADPNLVCSAVWPQFPIHAAAEFGHIGILKRLCDVTDRACDRDEAMVSPLYSAMRQRASMELLLKEGFHPDAQSRLWLNNPTPETPLSLALEWSSKPSGDVAGLLIAAGASLNHMAWLWILNTDTADWLQLVLQHRRSYLSRLRPRQPQNQNLGMNAEELDGLVSAGQYRDATAACWLPLLLQAGLEPSLFMHPDMLENIKSDVLNYFLEFVNWSTLSRPLRQMLDQRQEKTTWTPHPHLERMPSLSHLCRLQIREVLGSDALMRTEVVRQLPLPPLLQKYLQFQEIIPP